MGLRSAVLDVLGAFSQHFGNPVKISSESVYFQVEDSVKQGVAVLSISVRGPRDLIDKLSRTLKVQTYNMLAEEGRQIEVDQTVSNVAVLHPQQQAK